MNTITNDPGDGDESSSIEDATNQFHALSLAPPELGTHGDTEQVALETSLPTSSITEQRIISAGPSQEHSTIGQAFVTQEQPLSTTSHVAPSTLVTPEARVADKSKKGKVREKETVQDTAAAVVEAVPGTKKTRKSCTRKT